jgi:ribosome-interacting GTPase 1
MASTNQSPQYQKAEVKFLSAKTDEEKLVYLEEMIRECPKHKSSEKMLANLKTRYKKLKEKIGKLKKSGKGKKQGIRKEEMQAVIMGFTNTGKSSLLSLLTNAKPKIALYDFATKKPVVGMTDYHGTNMQLIEIPAVESEYYDKGLVNTADAILILIDDLNQIDKIEKELGKTSGKKIFVFNLKDPNKDKKKISATLASKKYNFVLVSTKTGQGIEELKDKLFQSFGKLRVFTKEPGKEKSKKPLILEPKTLIKEVADKILKNLSSLKETKIWGPSSKFPGQIVGLQHELKDMDIIEFKTR